MFSDPRGPILFGVGMLLLMGCFIALNHPMPGALSSPHSNIHESTKLSSCSTCHSEQGLAQGCLDCHEEIQDQLDQNMGFHHFLLKEKEIQCANCHMEHLGKDFKITNLKSWRGVDPQFFRHEHVEFQLVGQHNKLDCIQCHNEEFQGKFQLSDYKNVKRTQSFLGLNQECISCHEDIHSGGLSKNCESCHDQNAFNPASKFDHGLHFPLTGAHTKLSCQSCHEIAESGTSERLEHPFGAVKGTQCHQCHNSPHLVDLAPNCETCHLTTDTTWTQALEVMTAKHHKETSFPLESPHHEVSCEKCHESELEYLQKYPSIHQLGYNRQPETCNGCHQDVHGGQFDDRYSQCTDCHSDQHFIPSNFGHSLHAKVYPLTAPHKAVSCLHCHDQQSENKVVQFAGTPRSCKSCHENPHGKQFQNELLNGDCSHCHSEEHQNFKIVPFDHFAQTGYLLDGAHLEADCSRCHPSEKNETSKQTQSSIVKYRGISQKCSSCHDDYHQGQFEKSQTCDSCHTSRSSWKKIDFDHNTQSKFHLDKTHAKVDCKSCHPQITAKDGSKLTQFKPLGMECQDCHELPKR